MKKIVDVSSYNGTVNWAKVKKYGCSGAILKIIRKDLERDKGFNANYVACNKNKIPWGVYNYTYADTVKKARSDMNLVCDILDKIDKSYFKYGVWFDLEDKVQAKLTKSQIADIVNAAQEVVEKRGYIFGVYTGKAYFEEHIDRKKVLCRNWWIARYYRGDARMQIATNPNEKYKPTMTTIAWQYTSKGRFPKIVSTGNSGNFDLNILYKEPLEKEEAKEEEKTEEKPKKVYAGNLPVLKPKAYFAIPDGIKTSEKRKNVEKIQNFLNWAIDAGLTVDGKYGTKTETAVAVFQELCGIKADGKFGNITLAKAKTFKK